MVLTHKACTNTIHYNRNLLLEIGAVELSGDIEEPLEDSKGFDGPLLAGLPLDVMIPEFVRAELEPGAHHRSLVQPVI